MTTLVQQEERRQIVEGCRVSPWTDKGYGIYHEGAWLWWEGESISYRQGHTGQEKCCSFCFILNKGET